MAVKNVVAFVCDLDGELAVRSVTFGVNGDHLQLDLCEKHFTQFMESAHAPRRGRLPRGIGGMGAAPIAPITSRGRAKPQGQKKTTTRKKRKRTAKTQESAVA